VPLTFELASFRVAPDHEASLVSGDMFDPPGAG
jgi:hypothetical protein